MKPIHFFLGVAAGAAVGLLCAPKSGAKSRAFLAKSTKRSVDQSAEYLQQQGERLKSAAKEQIESAMTAGKQAYREVVSRA
jgi:gas vesicle protein